MKTYTIKQVGNSRSIHDLASTNYDREIRFPLGHYYAVVLAAYYNGKGYTTHKTKNAAAKESSRQAKWSHSVIDSDGNFYQSEHIYDGFHLTLL